MRKEQSVTGLQDNMQCPFDICSHELKVRTVRKQSSCLTEDVEKDDNWV